MQEPIILKNFYNCGIIKQIKLGETFLANKNNSLGFYKAILTTLITSLAITGISCLDDKIWNIIINSNVIEGIGTGNGVELVSSCNFDELKWNYLSRLHNTVYG